MADTNFNLEDTLPFDDKGQSATLGYILTDRNFFLQALGKLKPIDFPNPYHQKIYAGQLEFYSKYGSVPTVDEIRTKLFTEESTEDRKKIVFQVNIALEDTKNYSLEYLRDAISQWMHVSIFKQEMPNVINLFKNRKIKDSFNLLGEIDKKRRTIKFEDNGQVTFDDMPSFLKESELVYNDVLTTGFSLLDQALLENYSGKGGLVKGETTILLAPLSSGKTTTLVNIIKHNILAKKSVLFMTHEGRTSDIKEKLLRALLSCTRKELFEMFKYEQGQRYIEEATNYLNKYLVYYPYVHAGMTVEDVAAIISRLQEQRLTDTGKGFDLFLDDYPGKLGTTQGSQWEKRHAVSYVYSFFQDLAIEHNWHSILAQQTNREGSKLNRTIGDEDTRPIVAEDAAESYNVVQNCDNIISINRGPVDEIKNIIWYFIAKTRSNKKNIMVCCKSNFAKSVTFDDKLGGFTYHGGSIARMRVEELLQKYNNKNVPNEEFLGGLDK